MCAQCAGYVRNVRVRRAFVSCVCIVLNVLVMCALVHGHIFVLCASVCSIRNSFNITPNGQIPSDFRTPSALALANNNNKFRKRYTERRMFSISHRYVLLHDVFDGTSSSPSPAVSGMVEAAAATFLDGHQKGRTPNKLGAELRRMPPLYSARIIVVYCAFSGQFSGRFSVFRFCEAGLSLGTGRAQLDAACGAAIARRI